MDYIDLRSDTVTWPTVKMRHAMAEASVGDDVYGEDPTVNALERAAAERFGKEAGLLVTSGTMGNMVCLLAHCGRGDRAIMGNKSHTNRWEAGNPATLGGIQPWTLPVQPDGKFLENDLYNALTFDDPHEPYTKALSVENAQCGVGGQPLPAAYIDSLGEFCRANGLKLHIDGARIFNAAAALGEDVARIAHAADSLTFCLSKGLCAPIGSLVVGSEELIYKARRARKALGGGLRQAGVIAAAGLIALEEMTERLSEDHTNAKILAEGLARIDGVEADPDQVKTNMFWFNLQDSKLDAPTLSEKLRADNIILAPYGTRGKNDFRVVTHYWIQPAHIERVLERVKFHLS